MNYVMSFVIGGAICVIGQILIDKFKLNSAYILVSFVVSGAILGFFGIYEKIIEWGYSGATVPLPGFGYTLAKGAMSEALENGLLGALGGGIKATAAGVGTALFTGLLVALIFNPKEK